MRLSRLGLRAGDVILAGGLLLASAAIAAALLFFPSAVRATVLCGGEPALRIALPCEHTFYEVESGGFHLTIEAEGGRVRVAGSDCPDQTCVRTGWLSRSGSAAACVPAGVVLSLEGGDEPSVDGVLR